MWGHLEKRRHGSSPCSDHTEGTLAYDCPEARRAVLTSIVTNKLTLKKLDGSKLSLWCPRCVTSTVAVSSATIAVSKGDELLIVSSLRAAWRGTGIIAKITRSIGRFWLSVITGCYRFFANGRRQPLALRNLFPTVVGCALERA